jgi:hypothetical protein
MKILKKIHMINKKLKQQITQTHGKGLSKLLLQVSFSNHLDFKTLSSICTMVNLHNLRSRVK